MSKEKIELDETAVDLLLFMKDKEINFNGEKIIAWISFYDISEFCKLFTADLFDEGGLDVKLQEEYIALDLKEVIDYRFVGEENEYIVRKLREMNT